MPIQPGKMPVPSENNPSPGILFAKSQRKCLVLAPVQNASTWSGPIDTIAGE
jgi:hypothetical protein